MLTILQVPVVLAVLLQVTAATDYCGFSDEHQLCIHTEIGGACDGDPMEKGFTPAEIDEIVRLHNEYRASVANGQEARGKPGPQDTAANMMQLIWDDELGKIAQAHANQCVFGHDCSDCRKVERFDVGQNIWSGSNTADEAKPDIPAALQSFYEEVTEHPPKNTANYKFSEITGHYTQMVWAKTTHLGCGYTKYKQDSWFKKLIVCNYGPAGNYQGEPIYISSKPCSECPAGTTCSTAYPGLCTGDVILSGGHPTTTVTSLLFTAVALLGSVL